MNIYQRVFGIRSYQVLRKQIFCRLGFHGPTTGPDGKSANFCVWDCGMAFNPHAFQDYIVTLKDGSVFEVSAVNEYHAGSEVVYGKGGKIDSRGTPLSEVRIHRENIDSIQLKNQTHG